MGHNEDGGKISVNTSYMVHARITNSTSQAAQEFTALCYAAELCGTAFGYNLNTGIVTTCNAVFPKNINSSAVRKFYALSYHTHLLGSLLLSTSHLPILSPFITFCVEYSNPLPYSLCAARNYLNRLSLSADYAQLLSTLHSVPCSSGFSLNVGQLDSLAVTNLEVWPGGISVFKVSGYNYHFNMYADNPTPLPPPHPQPITNTHILKVSPFYPRLYLLAGTCTVTQSSMMTPAQITAWPV